MSKMSDMGYVWDPDKKEWVDEITTAADDLLASIEDAGNKINKEEAEALEELYGDLSMETISTLVPGVEFSDGASRIFSGMEDTTTGDKEEEKDYGYDYQTGTDQFDETLADIEAENASMYETWEKIKIEQEEARAQFQEDLAAQIEEDRAQALAISSAASSNLARQEAGVSELKIEDNYETSLDGGTSAFRSRDTQYNVTPYTGLSTISSGMVNV